VEWPCSGAGALGPKRPAETRRPGAACPVIRPRAGTSARDVLPGQGICRIRRCLGGEAAGSHVKSRRPSTWMPPCAPSRYRFLRWLVCKASRGRKRSLRCGPRTHALSRRSCARGSPHRGEGSCRKYSGMAPTGGSARLRAGLTPLGPDYRGIDIAPAHTVAIGHQELRARQEIAESGGTSRHRGIPGHGAVL